MKLTYFAAVVGLPLLASFRTTPGSPAPGLPPQLGPAGGGALGAGTCEPDWRWAFGGRGLTSSKPGDVYEFALFDDGGGPALYAGGDFLIAGGSAASYVARWDGSAWSALGGGLDQRVLALAVYDDGGGPALYAAGAFTNADGAPASHVARWDGSSWSALGSGTSGRVHTLAVYDDGARPALYVGGDFNVAGGASARSVARWDGGSWSSLGAGVQFGEMPADVLALAAYDDGTGGGPELFVGGTFTNAGGANRSRLARWNGASWADVSEGTSDRVRALTVHDDLGGLGPVLVAGGSFDLLEPGESHLARWGGCAPVEPGSAYCFGDGTGTACPCGNASGPGAGCANSSGVGAVLAGHGTASALADDLWFRASRLVPNQPGLLFVGTLAANGGAGIVFGDGLRCAVGTVGRFEVELPDTSGDAYWGPGLRATGAWLPGDRRRFQAWYRDPSGGPCNSTFNLSNGYEVVFGL